MACEKEGSADCGRRRAWVLRENDRDMARMKDGIRIGICYPQLDAGDNRADGLGL